LMKFLVISKKTKMSETKQELNQETKQELDQETKQDQEEEEQEEEEEEEEQDEKQYSKKTITSFYQKMLITKKIALYMNNLGHDIITTLEKYIQIHFEGKCHKEGNIKKGSSHIIHYSAGHIFDGNRVVYDVVFESDVCYLVEGMVIECIVTNISNGGIRCISYNEKPSPIIAHVSENYYLTKNKKYKQYYQQVKEGDKVMLKILCQRFELNDLFIEICAEFYI
jgi:DNA-directed RNA polymerase subunit E'/Rpb7